MTHGQISTSNLEAAFPKGSLEEAEISVYKDLISILSFQKRKKKIINRCRTESGIAQKLLETQRTNPCLCVHKHPPRRAPNAFIWVCFGFFSLFCQSLFTPLLFWPCMTNVQRCGSLQDKIPAANIVYLTTEFNENSLEQNIFETRILGAAAALLMIKAIMSILGFLFSFEM